MKNPIKQFYKLHYIEKYENYIKSKKVFLAIFLIITNLLGGLVFGYALGTIGGGLSSAITAFFPSNSSTLATTTNQTSTNFMIHPPSLNNHPTPPPNQFHWFNTMIEPLSSIMIQQQSSSSLSMRTRQFNQNLECILLWSGKILQQNADSEGDAEKCFASSRQVYDMHSKFASRFILETNANATTNGTSTSTTTTPFDLGTSVLQGLYSAAIFIGGLFGCLFAMASGPILGRKISIMLCCLISVIGSVGAAASFSWASLIVFRCILGFGAGIATAICSVYCAELMPYAKYQGVLGSMFNMGISLGTTFGYVFGAIFVRSSEMWRAVHAFDNLFVIPLFLIVLFIIPESPLFIHGGSHGETPSETNAQNTTGGQELKDANSTGEKETSSETKKPVENVQTMSTLAAFQRLFCSKVIRGTILACFGCFALEWTGIQSATMFTPSLIASAGVTDPLGQQLASFGVSVWQIFCIIPTMFLIDRLGRKPIIIFGFTVSLIMDLALGFIFQFGQDGSDYKIILSLVFICLYLIGFHCGIGSLGYILAHEVFNGENEKVIVIGTSMATLVMWSTTIVLSLFFIPVVTVTNQAVPWFIFAGVSLIGLLLYIFVLQETSPTVLAKRAAKKQTNPRPEPEATSNGEQGKSPSDGLNGTELVLNQ